jgi:hypothetical protein
MRRMPKSTHRPVAIAAVMDVAGAISTMNRPSLPREPLNNYARARQSFAGPPPDCYDNRARLFGMTKPHALIVSLPGASCLRQTAPAKKRHALIVS